MSRGFLEIRSDDDDSEQRIEERTQPHGAALRQAQGDLIGALDKEAARRAGRAWPATSTPRAWTPEKLRNFRDLAQRTEFETYFKRLCPGGRDS